MTPTQPTQPMTSMLVFAGRLFWTMLGPMVLAILAFAIVSNGGGWLTPPDFAFLAVLGGMLLGRWLEFRGGSPLTSTGEPATSAHLHRYVLSVVLLGLVAWLAVNLIGNYWLAR